MSETFYRGLPVPPSEAERIASALERIASALEDRRGSPASTVPQKRPCVSIDCISFGKEAPPYCWLCNGEKNPHTEREYCGGGEHVGPWRRRADKIAGLICVGCAAADNEPPIAKTAHRSTAQSMQAWTDEALARLRSGPVRDDGYHLDAVKRVEALANALGIVLAQVNRYDDARAGDVRPISDYAREKREALEFAQRLLNGEEPE